MNGHRRAAIAVVLAGSAVVVSATAISATSLPARPSTPAKTTTPTLSTPAPTAAVPTTTATVPPASGATSSPSPPTTTVPAAPTSPPTDARLANRIPAVAGYSIASVPADDPFWREFDFSIPADLARHHAYVVAADGAAIARLAVAASMAAPAIDVFVDRVFVDEVMLPFDATEMDGGVMIAANAASPIWTEMEGSAVIVAEQELDGNFQWAWTADGLVWIVRGREFAEDYVRALLRLQAPSLDPFDQQGLTGELFDHTPLVPGFRYADLPREATLASLPSNPLGDCVARFYVGYVLADGVVDDGYGQTDLGVSIMEAAGWCVEDGFLDDLTTEISTSPGVRVEQIGGLTAYRDETRVISLIGDVAVVLVSGSPQTFVDMASYIERFMAGQPR